MKISWLSSLTDYIGIDLGSTRVRVWGKTSGLIIDDAAAVAIDTRLQKVIAVGQEAAEMRGRVSSHIEVIFPMTADGIQDQDIAAAMLRAILQRVFRLGLFFRPVMAVSVHPSLGEPERRQLIELFLQVGAREVILVDEVLAAAIGSGVPIADASGSVFLHTGASVADVGMISLGSVITSKTSKLAGQYLTQLFQHYIKEHYEVLLGEGRAEQLKVRTLGQGEKLPARIRVSGQDIVTRTPKEIVIEGSSLQPLIEYIATQYVVTVQSVLSDVPPELSQDVLDKGMLLSGGSAPLAGLATQLSERLGIPVSVVDQPQLAVVKGLGQVLSNLRLFTQSVAYRSTTQDAR